VDQPLSGKVHGNTIVLDSPLPVPDGQTVEVVIRPPRASLSSNAGTEKLGPPAWWTGEDDRILAEIHQSRKQDRPEIEV
jgi:hypothetical protein